MDKKIVLLKEMMDEGRFHHATWRDNGRLWEGWHIYERCSDEQGGFRGFKHSMAVFTDDPSMAEATAMLRGAGYSLGAYGEG